MRPSLDDHPVGCTLTDTDGLLARLAQAGLKKGKRLAKFYDADPASFTRSNFLVTEVHSVVELVEPFCVVAILAPLARSRQEAVLAFERSDDDPHSVSDP